MNAPRPVREYLEKRVSGDYPIISAGLAGIEQAVVVPALAEKDYLFSTLASLARNPAEELKRTLVICVVNNRGPRLATRQEREDNQETLSCLTALIAGDDDGLAGDEAVADHVRQISRSPLRLACIDAATPGREMPDKGGGVGLARKIGMDAALKVLDYERNGSRLIISLDADTLVASNYLSAIGEHFEQDRGAAVVNYAHRLPAAARERLAIATYEIDLRYYVLGLRYAGSPYAFPSIGSTMVCRADAYVAVGGMNRREGAEDFYFLNKLAKRGTISRIRTTTVYPSARPSRRVPFGTGRRITRFLEGGADEFLLYNPRVFALLREWLAFMTSCPERDGREIAKGVFRIEPQLLAFLEQHRFFENWDRIGQNARGGETMLRHFHGWFDGFKTLKLIHFLTEHGFPRISMFDALRELFNLLSLEMLRCDRERVIPSVYEEF